MQCRPAPILALLLSLMITLTSVSVGAARGMAPAAGWVMLCAGDQTTSVPVDRDGRPTERHSCPDCQAVTVALPPAITAQAFVPWQSRRAAPIIIAPDATPAPPMAFTARAPPRLI